jgi:transmembrane sensor
MDRQKIKDYLEGKSTKTESGQVREWIMDAKNESMLREILGEIWNAYDIKLIAPKPEFEALLGQVHHHINLESVDSREQRVDRTLYNSGWYRMFSRVAAILLIPLLVYTAYLVVNGEFRSGSSSTFTATFTPTREIYTKPGTRTKIELSDGTLVWLNDGTTFRYPEQFTQNSRQVFVDGEAYFEVKSNPKSPFIVINPMMTTTVTGTHFNLNAYSRDAFFEASLLEGKIQLSNRNNHADLLPGEQVQFDTITNRLQRKVGVNTSASAAWINGKLIIQNEQLGIAIKKISRWYNVEMILRDKNLSNLMITATFENEKLDQTLKLLALAIPVKFTYKNEADALKIQRIIYLDRR